MDFGLLTRQHPQVNLSLALTPHDDKCHISNLTFTLFKKNTNQYNDVCVAQILTLKKTLLDSLEVAISLPTTEYCHYLSPFFFCHHQTSFTCIKGAVCV